MRGLIARAQSQGLVGHKGIYLGYIRIMESKMENTTLCWGIYKQSTLAGVRSRVEGARQDVPSSSPTAGRK